MLQGSCPSRTAPDFVLERTKSGDVRKMHQFTHVMAAPLQKRFRNTLSVRQS